MTQRLAWMMVLATLGAAHAPVTRAQVEEELPSIRNADGPIPANSALVLDTPQGPPRVQIKNDAGAFMPGELVDINNSGSLVYAWLPTRPLEPGEYEVHFVGPDSEDWGTTSLTIAPAEPHEPLPIESAPTVMREVSPVTECCGMPPPRSTEQGACFVVEEYAFMRLLPGLSVSDDLAVSDYVYRLRSKGPPQARSDLPFKNFYDLTDASFDEAGEQYCVELQALELATGRLFVYEELSICAESDEGPLGDYEVVVPDDALRLSVCEVPPVDPYRERWCALNADECTPQAKDVCEVHAYECEGGPYPSAWRDRIHAADGIMRNAGPSSSGCSVTQRHAARGASALAIAAGLLCAVLATRLSRARGRSPAGAGR